MKKYVLISSVAGVVALAGIAFASPPERQGQPEGRGHKGRLPIAQLVENPAVVEKVGITEQEVEAIQEASYAVRKASIEIRSDKQLAQLELDRLIDAGADESDVLAAVEKLGEYQTGLHKIQVKNQLQVRNILGEEKYEALKAYQKEQMRKRGKRRGDRLAKRKGGSGRERSENGPPWLRDEMPPPEEE